MDYFKCHNVPCFASLVVIYFINYWSRRVANCEVQETKNQIESVSYFCDHISYLYLSFPTLKIHAQFFFRIQPQRIIWTIVVACLKIIWAREHESFNALSRRQRWEGQYIKSQGLWKTFPSWGPTQAKLLVWAAAERMRGIP